MSRKQAIPKGEEDLKENNNQGNPPEEKKVIVDNVELKTIEVRLDGVKEATKRSRFVFIVMTIVSSAILITLWNAYFSWIKGMADLPKASPDQTDPLNLRALSNQDLIISQWIQNQTISVGLLGIRVSAPDLAVIGSASLIVVMIWYFFSQRRENRTIVTLLRDVHEAYKKEKITKETCQMVYHGVVQNVVFINIGGGDAPIIGIERDKPVTGVERDKGFSENTTNWHDSKLIRKLPLRKVLYYLVYLPPFTIGMTILCDFISLTISSPFRDCPDSLIICLWLEKGELLKILFFETFAILTFFYTWGICDACREFSRSTGKTIKEFRIYEN